ncbi:MAG: ABC transporter permease subunit [Actinomycetota bacterium]|nr:ABC transporter permease subunit [Actinomycetota bacterium]
MAQDLGSGDGPLNAPSWLKWAWVPPALFLAVLLGAPITTVLQHSLEAVGNFDWSSTMRIAGLAAVQALISAGFALAIGIPLAAVLSSYQFRGRALTQALVTVPFVLPTVVIALAFRGLLGSFLEPGFLLVIAAHTYINLAVIVRIVGATWQQLDTREVTAARALGATPFRAFVTVTLPQLRGAILSAAAVVFVFCFTSLGVVLVLGDSSTRTLESQILRETSLLLDFPTAAMTAVLQLILVTVVLLLGARASVTRTRSTPVLRIARLPRPRRLRQRIFVFAIAGAGVAIVLLPLVSLAFDSIRGQDGWTLQWWQSLTSLDAGTTRLASPASAIAVSLKYAVISGLIAGFIGVLAAMSVLAHRVGRAVALVALAPLGLSAATLGLGLMLSFGRPPIDLRSLDLLIPLAHSLVAVPLVIAVVLPTLRATDARAATVASALGARPTRAFFTAYGPTLRIVLLAAGGLAACVSLGEFGAASFLARSGAPTVPLQIMRLLQRPGDASLGVATALAMVLVIGTVLLILGVDALGRRSLAR